MHKKCLILLRRCAKGAQRVLNCLSGAQRCLEGASSGLQVLYPCLNIQLLTPFFVILCIGISLILLFGSGLEIMVSEVREPSVISNNSKNMYFYTSSIIF